MKIMCSGWQCSSSGTMSKIRGRGRKLHVWEKIHLDSYTHWEWISFWLLLHNCDFLLPLSLWLKTFKELCSFFSWVMRSCIRPHCLSAVRQKPRAHSLKAIREGAEESGQSASGVCRTKSCKGGETIALEIIWTPRTLQVRLNVENQQKVLEFLPSLTISFRNSHYPFPPELGSHIILHLFYLYAYCTPCDNSPGISQHHGLNCVLQKCVCWSPNLSTLECDCT